MIRLDKVSFHYGGEHGSGEGVEAIDLSIGSGEFVVLCGRSGCGKTTVTRLINGLAPQFYPGEMKGTVEVGGVAVSTEPLSHTAALIGNVFQNPKSQFFNVDTTGELVFGCENQGMPASEIGRRLEKTVTEMKLEGLTGRNIFELSGGEKQQIACASVYTVAPQVYVLDEPSSNLDQKAIRRLHDILQKIKQEGATVILSEHRLHYLMDLADRFLYMADGRMVREFTSEEIQALPDGELEQLGLRCTDLTKLKRNPAFQPSFSAAPKAAVEALDLSCHRADTQILDMESLALPESSIVAMIGDNGCGKSTLAESLCGVIPSGGSVAFAGKYLTNKERYRRSYLVMQDVNRQLFGESVWEEVRLNAAVSEAETETILQALGLAAMKDRHPAALSGGQKQRVAIASALCAGKEILFYDEPTSGLDRQGMERFGRLLQDMREKLLASVIITHDPELIFTCCTHVLHVENGRVLAFYPLNEEGAERVRYYFLKQGGESVSPKRETSGKIGKILQYAGKYRKYTYLAAALMTVGAAARVLPFLAIYRLLAAVIAGQSIGMRDAAVVIAVVLLGQLGYTFFYTFGFQYSHLAAYHTLENIRRHLQAKMEQQPLGDILNIGTGAVKKLFIDDIESIELLLAHLIPEGIANLTVPAAGFLLLVAVDWQLALMTLLMLLFGLAASGQMYALGMDQMSSYFAAAKRLNNTIIEYVNGMEAVRIFNRQGEVGRKYAGAVSGYRDFALAWYKICWPWMALYSSLFSNILLYTLPFGALLVFLGQISLSRYVLALCLNFAIGPLLLHCISFMGLLPQANYKIQALEKAMDRRALKTGEQAFTGQGYDICFEQVHFGYQGEEVIKGISFQALSGQMTALVGESGSGKSTLARLLVHYYDVSGGRICLGGQDIREMSLAALNQQIAYVSQELFLFNRSILENIRIGRPAASDEEVKTAARKAGCEEFILALEQGYDTLAGSAGSSLSGGQRQRIAFARAILKDAPVIVLDEATAFIDPENEQKMNQAIRQIIAGKTVIVIAHKLRQVAGADQIILLKEGKVHRCGRHEELVKDCALYQKLWAASESAQAFCLKAGKEAEA